MTRTILPSPPVSPSIRRIPISSRWIPAISNRQNFKQGKPDLEPPSQQAISPRSTRRDRPESPREARPIDKRPVGNDIGRVIATWMAGLRPKFARVIGPIAAQMALGMATLIRGTRSRAARLRVGATALAANLRPKFVRSHRSGRGPDGVGNGHLDPRDSVPSRPTACRCDRLGGRPPSEVRAHHQSGSRPRRRWQWPP